MYTFRAPVARRNSILRCIQRREVVIVDIRLLVESIANGPTSRGHTLLMLIEHGAG